MTIKDLKHIIKDLDDDMPRAEEINRAPRQIIKEINPASDFLLGMAFVTAILIIANLIS